MATPTLQGEARFELKGHLSPTLQGRLYSAVDRNTGKLVVVKETWKQLVRLGKSRDGHTVPENFEEEKRILTYLSSQKDAHPGFAKILDEWSDKDCYLYAMEMCRDGELFEYIKGEHAKGAVAHFTRQQARGKQIEMAEANEWIKVVQHMFRQLAECTAWMHSKGVCHLDMSLENAMIASKSSKYGNQIKIIDFGLAKYYSDGNFTNNRRVGKTSYMAPEVFARKTYDPRAADIWSLGVMLFMMLIGAPPYQIASTSNPAFNFIVNGRLRDVLKHWKRLGCVTKEALDLLNKIFRPEPKRIKMKELLQHAFVHSTTLKEKQTAEEKTDTQSEEEVKPAKETKAKPQPAQQPQTQAQEKTQIEAQTDNTTNNTDTATPNEKEEDAKPQPPAGSGTEAVELSSYTFQTPVAKDFAEQLTGGGVMAHEQLTALLGEVEQVHNANQAKLRGSATSDAQLERSVQELSVIHKAVEQRLQQSDEDEQNEQSSANMKTAGNGD